MQRELAAHWRVPADVFYDRPPDFFRAASLQASALAGIWHALLLVCGAGSALAVHGQLPTLRGAQPKCLCHNAWLPGMSALLQEKHALLQKLQPALASGLHPQDFVAELYASGLLAAGDTLCTTRTAGGRAERRPGRPALVVSSTSWTPDEDFGILLKAAEVGNLKIVAKAGTAVLGANKRGQLPCGVTPCCPGHADGSMALPQSRHA